MQHPPVAQRAGVDDGSRLAWSCDLPRSRPGAAQTTALLVDHVQRQAALSQRLHRRPSEVRTDPEGSRRAAATAAPRQRASPPSSCRARVEGEVVRTILLRAGQLRFEQFHPPGKIGRRGFQQRRHALQVERLHAVHMVLVGVQAAQQFVVGGDLGQGGRLDRQLAARAARHAVGRGNRQPQQRIEQIHVALDQHADAPGLEILLGLLAPGPQSGAFLSRSSPLFLSPLSRRSQAPRPRRARRRRCPVAAAGG